MNSLVSATRLFLVPLQGAIAILLCLASCPAIARGEYSGPDAGVLVISFGSLGKQADGYTFWYKPRGQKPGWFPDDVGYEPHSILFDHAPDYSGHEAGQVHILHLKPGDYEIYRAAIFANAGIQNFTFDLPEFSLPFTIRPGEATYVGDLAGAAEWRGGALQGGYYVVSDRHERDLDIARRKDAQLPPVTVAVPDVSGMADRLILSEEKPGAQ
jgi:hypothetical protein